MLALALQVVLSKPTPDARVEDGEFEENEAWALDIVLSTGEGKPKARSSLHHLCLLRSPMPMRAPGPRFAKETGPVPTISPCIPSVV